VLEGENLPLWGYGHRKKSTAFKQNLLFSCYVGGLGGGGGGGVGGGRGGIYIQPYQLAEVDRD